MKYFGSGRSGAFDWFFQRISGIVLLVTLFLHFYVMHFAIDGPITYEKVMVRLASPGWKALDIVFLVFAIYHAINGFKLIIDDYVHSTVLRAVIVGLLWVVGISFLVIGIMTIVNLQVQS
ncbi:MAG TPA: succinate dehydrogenase, hydrophobic membrane anchor protein [Deltaproteobacteria bacterium]|nr:succinate dehydrogenase, hydrophobic membrane anchor protein [Deltaproteobacteria bacterium]